MIGNNTNSDNAGGFITELQGREDDNYTVDD